MCKILYWALFSNLDPAFTALGQIGETFFKAINNIIHTTNINVKREKQRKHSKSSEKGKINAIYGSDPEVRKSFITVI